MDQINATLRLHMWLESSEGQLVGLGRILLLREIQRQGSLNKAAKALGMSYRAAWGRLKTSEQMIGQALVEKSAGTKGFVLTEFGEDLVERFTHWYDNVEKHALETARETFQWNVAPYENDDPFIPE